MRSFMSARHTLASLLAVVFLSGVLGSWVLAQPATGGAAKCCGSDNCCADGKCQCSPDGTCACAEGKCSDGKCGADGKCACRANGKNAAAGTCCGHANCCADGKCQCGADGKCVCAEGKCRVDGKCGMDGKCACCNGPCACGSNHKPAAKTEAGPNGCRKVDNEKCPVMGHACKPDMGFAYNGWWIGICCGGCDEKFMKDVDAYAAKILEQTKIDVRKLAPREAGPEGTVRLGNTKCPITGEAVDSKEGVAYNGWWIGVCCDDDCAKEFSAHPDKFAEVIIKQLGIDVRQPAPKLEK